MKAYISIVQNVSIVSEKYPYSYVVSNRIVQGRAFASYQECLKAIEAFINPNDYYASCFNWQCSEPLEISVPSEGLQ